MLKVKAIRSSSACCSYSKVHGNVANLSGIILMVTKKISEPPNKLKMNSKIKVQSQIILVTVSAKVDFMGDY